MRRFPESANFAFSSIRLKSPYFYEILTHDIVILQAQSGTGKTGTFTIATL